MTLIRSLDEARRLELPARLRPAGTRRGAMLVDEGFVVRHPGELANAFRRCLAASPQAAVEVSEAPPLRR